MPDADLPAAADAGFAPADPEFLADPYPVFARMREVGPAFDYPARGVTLLTRFADVHAALRDRSLGRAPMDAAPPGPYPRFEASERWSLLNLEPPDHTRLRRLVTKVFTARSVAALAPRIEDLAQRQLDTLDQEFDLLTDFAQPYSIAVICTLLGIPQDNAQQLLDWSHAIVKMYEFATPETEKRAADTAAGDFIDYVREVIADRRARPADDLITELVTVSDAGDTLTEDEIIGTVIVLLNAGHEATVNTMGNGLRALMLHPDQWQRLRAEDVPAAVAVEELLRWDAPLQLFERWVLRDGLELAGQQFGRGERIGMMFGSANRDDDRFPDAAAFDVGRGESTHIGFGGGLHFCIGAPLARLELSVALDRLRTLDLELAQMPTYQPYFVIRGLSELRLRRRG